MSDLSELSIVRLIVLLLAGFTGLAQAQTATDINCLGCVGRNDIAGGAVAAPKLATSAVTTAKIKSGAVTLDRLAPEVRSRLLPEPSVLPYQPRIVNVVCDGGGPRLNDAIGALNPAAEIYDIHITGNCDENLELVKFQSITLRSADASIPATIGRVFVKDQSSYVGIFDLELRTGPAVTAGAIVSNVSSGRLHMERVKLLCDPTPDSGQCTDRVVGSAGDLRLFDVSFVGAWEADDDGRKGSVEVSRGGTATIQSLGDYCLSLRQILAGTGATIQVVDPCDTGLLSVRNGGLINYVGNKTAAVEARQGTIVGSSSLGAGVWVRSITCSGVLSAVVDSQNGTINYCSP